MIMQLSKQLNKNRRVQLAVFLLTLAGFFVAAKDSEYYADDRQLSNSIIVVGGGCSLKNKANGKLIDSFSKVVRVNNHPAGFEDHAGTKVDYIFASFATNFSRKEFESVSPTQIYMSAGEHFGNMEFLRRRVEKFNPEDLNILDNNYFTDMRTLLHLEHPKHRASTGVVAVHWAIRNFPHKQVYVTGLDYNTSCPHYYEESNQRWTTSVDVYHDFGKEAAHLWTLSMNGVIKPL